MRAGLVESVAVLNVLGDPTRIRLLALLEREALSVGELTEITGLPQSRVSTHLGRLREAGLVRDRKVGTSTIYRLASGLDEDVKALWQTLTQMLDDELLDEDGRRRDAVVAARGAGHWPDGIAGQMERHYSPGRTWESLARALPGLMRPGRVLDVGSGDGTVGQLLAGRYRELVCLDRSDSILSAARDRLAGRSNVSFVRGDMHELPFADRCFDQVLLLNVLPFSDRPERVVAEAARVLAPDGDLLLTTLAPHEARPVTEAYGHVNQGVHPSDLATWLDGAGLTVNRCEVTSREHRKPRFAVVTAFATKNQRTHR